ncbi:hypothetical protein H9I45_10260 [Polaribacter haliotis]|uniref:Uncharacterized protein n=1 Tax=Polaribacter haliotis TaxID=1888915 RepID=A0A7L8ACS4_9FLAO|nr:hypothetical protein [Polaribacter haliotis]QOD59734.1 hypothetical protein H9I45_10260 [Polaribacter haliotis]
MKNLIPIYMFLSVVFNAGVKTNSSTLSKIDRLNIEKEITATFDGAEGNYYFFTDSERNALQFEDMNLEVKKKYDLVAGDYVGKKFNINYKDKKIVNLKKVDK